MIFGQMSYSSSELARNSLQTPGLAVSGYPAAAFSESPLGAPHTYASY